MRYLEFHRSTRERPSRHRALFSSEPWPDHDEWLRELIPTARSEVYQVDGRFPHLADVARFTDSLRRLR
jgi:hypothetical protein